LIWRIIARNQITKVFNILTIKNNYFIVKFNLNILWFRNATNCINCRYRDNNTFAWIFIIFTNNIWVKNSQFFTIAWCKLNRTILLHIQTNTC
jgi:hypothetical protein